MKKTEKMKVLALLLAACVVLMLTGCEVSSSSSSTTTVTTSTTDADGNTTTNTTTTEVGASVGTDGVSTTNQTTTETTTTPAGEASSPSAEDLKAALKGRYVGGGKGTSKDGDTIYFAYDNPNPINKAALMIVSEDGQHLSSYEGEVYRDDDNDCSVLYDEDMDAKTPFTIEDGEGDTYIMHFLGDGDEASMTMTDLDSLIDEMVAVYKDFMDNAA